MIQLQRLLLRLYLWACEQLYANMAWSYDFVSWLVSFGRWSSWRAALLPYLSNGRILEIGFGTGTLLAQVAQRRHNVIGLELSSTMHYQTARKLSRLALTVPRVQAPTQQMPFADGSFDTIISTFPSGYIADPDTLAECARLLRRPAAGNKGGQLYILMGVTATRSPLALLTSLLRSAPNENCTIANHNNQGEPSTEQRTLQPLAKLLRDAGLHSSAFSLAQGNALIHIVTAAHETAAHETAAHETAATHETITPPS